MIENRFYRQQLIIIFHFEYSSLNLPTDSGARCTAFQVYFCFNIEGLGIGYYLYPDETGFMYSDCHY